MWRNQLEETLAIKSVLFAIARLFPPSAAQQPPKPHQVSKTAPLNSPQINRQVSPRLYMINCSRIVREREWFVPHVPPENRLLRAVVEASQVWDILKAAETLSVKSRVQTSCGPSSQSVERIVCTINRINSTKWGRSCFGIRGHCLLLLIENYSW